MRTWHALTLVAVALAVATAFLDLGHKSDVKEYCAEPEPGCYQSRWDADYRVAGLRVVSQGATHTDDGVALDAPRVTYYAYGTTDRVPEAAARVAWFGLPLLALGLTTTAVAVLAGAFTRDTPVRRGALTAGLGLVGGALALTVFGVLLHAAYWTGAQASPFAPGVGLATALAAVACAGLAVARMHAREVEAPLPGLEGAGKGEPGEGEKEARADYGV